jgi:hypothetical protein
MALNFPSNPANGDEYISNGTTWQFDGTAWNILPASSLGYVNGFGSVNTGVGNIVASIPEATLNIAAGDNISFDVANNALTISSTAQEQFNFSIAADDSTQQEINLGETIRFIGGLGIDTSSDVEGNITITSTASSATFQGLTDVDAASMTIDRIYEPAAVRFIVDNVGVTSYTFAPHYTANNPNLYVISGTTVAFDLNAIPSLPFELQDATQTPLTTGLVHVATDGSISTGAAAQGKSSGTLYWRIPESYSGTYRYECQLYPAMFGVISIKRLSLI